jgi:hypothetical protein
MTWTLLRSALVVAALASRSALAGYSVQPYTTYTTLSWPDAVAIGDVNGDGRNDVVLTTKWYGSEANDFKTFIFLQNADGTLAAPVKVSYLASYINMKSGLALADLDHDGRDEIIVGHSGGITITRWGPFRNGVTASRLHVSFAPQGGDTVVVLDVNRDGHLDIVSQSHADGATVYIGDGHGSISRKIKLPTPAQGSNDMESGDFNHDGYEDILLSSAGSNAFVYVYANDGSDDLAPVLKVDPMPTYSLGVAAAGDFNNDGRDDFVVKNGANTLALYQQDVAGGMYPPLSINAGPNANAMVLRDLDRDGRDDLVVAHGDGRVGFYLDVSVSPNEQWIPGPSSGSPFNTQGLAVGDVNGDRCDDIVLANFEYGLLVHPGADCTAAPDLMPGVGLTTNRLALRLDNVGTGAAATPQVDVTLAVANGTLTLGALPAGCSLLAQTPLRADVRCVDASLAAGSSRTRVLSLSVSGGNSRNSITATARASTLTVELRGDNNVATRRLRGKLDSAPSIRATVSPRPTGLLRVGRDNR